MMERSAGGSRMRYFLRQIAPDRAFVTVSRQRPCGAQPLRNKHGARQH
jgi:hypothetical protein